MYGGDRKLSPEEISALRTIRVTGKYHDLCLTDSLARDGLIENVGGILLFTERGIAALVRESPDSWNLLA